MKCTIGSLFLWLFVFSCFLLDAQPAWRAASSGIHRNQTIVSPPLFVVNFKTDVGGANYIYGSYYDDDSVHRVIGVRKHGRWEPLPFSTNYSSYAADIAMFGDTLYVGGSFGDVRLDNATAQIFPSTSIVKLFQDSLWVDSSPISIVDKMSTKGDSLIIWGGSYYNPPSQVIYSIFMTPDGGKSWMPPFSAGHPTGSTTGFGARPGVRFQENGDIYILNTNAPPGSPYAGVLRWDGVQWHAFGSGFSPWSQAYCLEFFKGDLIMGGSFNRSVYPVDPGDCVVEWNGASWNHMAGGANYTVIDLFTNDSLLFAVAPGASKFGDAWINSIAAWDGRRWCGTPSVFSTPMSSAGIINDTLFASFNRPPIYNGDTLPHLIYFDGDYTHGPLSVCSSPDIGVPEFQDVSIVVYPNPADDKLFIESGRDIEHIHFCNSLGQVLKEMRFDKGVRLVSIDLTSFEAGVYILEVNEAVYERVIVGGSQ